MTIFSSLSINAKIIDLTIPKGTVLSLIRSQNGGSNAYIAEDFTLNEHSIFRKGNHGILVAGLIESNGEQNTVFEKISIKDNFGNLHLLSINPRLKILPDDLVGKSDLKFNALVDDAISIKIDKNFLKRVDEDKYKLSSDSNIVPGLIESRIKSNWSPPKYESSYRQIVEFNIAPSGKVIKFRFVKKHPDVKINEALIKAINETKLPRLDKEIKIEFTFDYNVARNNQYKKNTKEPMSILELSKKAREQSD